MEIDRVQQDTAIKRIADRIAVFLEEKKGKNIEIIDIRKQTVLADYFIICHGTSTTHIKSLADEVDFRMETEEGRRCLHKEGYESARWVLLDYGDVIVHIFHEEDRQFYNLERLWSEGLKKRAEQNIETMMN